MGVARSVVVVSRCPDVGPACAAAFAELGDRVALVGAGAAPDGVTSVALETVDEAGVADAIEQALAAVGPAEVLVTVPGPGRPQSFLRADVGELQAQIDEHLRLTFLAARQLAPAMVKARKGALVFLSGITALSGSSWESSTGAALAGIVGLSRSLAREFAPAGVTVNVVVPGVVETAHLASVRAAGERSRAKVDAAIADTPLRRAAQPDEVAFAVRFLASDAAAYLTGVVLPVDGGLGMGFS